MMSRIVFSFLLTCVALIAYAQNPSAQKVLMNSIQYHDPTNQLFTKDLNFHFDESRPDGTIRKTVVRLAPKTEIFQIERDNGGMNILTSIHKDSVQYYIDGKEERDSEKLEASKLIPSKSMRMKDYYLYLWHLPMKLLDSGTLLDKDVTNEVFNGNDCYKVGVRYEAEVGKDRWYFYFTKDTYALVGYRFYHDESKNDGEYIYLEGEYLYDLIRLPKTRKWYTHKEDKYLGTDNLMKMTEQ